MWEQRAAQTNLAKVDVSLKPTAFLGLNPWKPPNGRQIGGLHVFA
jgi:hypothetical protein